MIFTFKPNIAPANIREYVRIGTCLSRLSGNSSSTTVWSIDLAAVMTSVKYSWFSSYELTIVDTGIAPPSAVLR